MEHPNYRESVEHLPSRVAKPSRIVACICALILLTVWAFSNAGAQQSADIIRGRVVGPDSQPIADVLVTALSYVGGIQKQKRTDKNGRYTIVYPNGEGAYWLQFNLIGFVSRRIEVKRRNDEDVLLANATLSKAQELNAVQVSGNVRLTLSRNDNQQEVSQTNRSITTGFVTVAPESRGDLAAQAAALPGVQLVPGVDGAPDRFSIFGLSGDQNNATLNGLQQGLSRLPREANTSLQLRTGYDVANGGASGATIAVITNSGTNQKSRPLSLILNAPQTQFPGPLGARSRYGAVSASARMTGPFSWDKDFYNVAVQYDHREQDLLSITSGANSALLAAGVAPDSVPSLLSALNAARIPTQARPATSRTVSDAGTILATIDWAPKSTASGHALTLTINSGFQSRGPNAFSLTSTNSSLLSTNSFNGGAQLRHTNFFGAGMLSESVIGISGSRFQLRPEQRATGANVFLTSSIDDSATTTRSLSLGGNSTFSTSSSYVVGARNTLSRISNNNLHRLKLTSELSLLGNVERQEQNTLGTFTYRSLDDLRANRSSAFTRNLGATSVDARAVIAGISIGDSWRPSPNLQLQYGLRADVTRFLTTPDRNPQLLSDLGRKTDRLPNSVNFSPRIGFSKTFLDSYVYSRGTTYELEANNSTLSGGVGLFQNVRGPELITGALSQTGLPTGSTTLECVGSASPVPNWQSFAGSEEAIPSTCLNGSSPALQAQVPRVTVFAPNFVEPRSLRGSLRYYTEQWEKHRTTFAVSYSYNFSQAGVTDVNLISARRFSLPDEENRTVFVAPSAIDPASGIASLGGSRISNNFGAVRELRSNLRAQSATFSFSDVRLNLREPFMIQFGYAFTYNREQYTGYSSSSGNPFSIEQSRGGIPMHDLNATLRYRVGEFAVLGLFGRLRSGTRFTPMVVGDINGDGNAFNDRAYVFGTGVGMSELLAVGSSSARKCLSEQLGTIARRNSCETPWTFGNSVLGIGINPAKLGLSPRLALQLSVANPAGALDLLLHGSSNARGWGQTPIVDQTLLYVNGFDATSSRFSYNVNQRFGDTRGRNILSETPAVLTLVLRYDFSPGFSWQAFNQSVQRGRGRTGAKMDEPAVRAMGAPGGSVIPVGLSFLLQSADNLGLTRVQADSLTRVVYRFNRIVDSLWTPVAKRAAALPTGYDESLLQRDFTLARAGIFDYWIEVMPSVRRLLTKGQLKSIATAVRDQLFNEDYLRRVRKQSVSFELTNVP